MRFCFFAKGGTFFASSRLRGNPSTRRRSRSIRNFDHSLQNTNKLIPACYPVPVFAETDPQPVFPFSKLSAVHLPHYPPKSFPFIIFAYPHPLNPVASIFYKKIGGRGRLRETPPIFHSLSPIPYNLSPFFSHSCALFSTCEKLYPFIFRRLRALCEKPPGVGGTATPACSVLRGEGDHAHSISQQANSVCLW